MESATPEKQTEIPRLDVICAEELANKFHELHLLDEKDKVPKAYEAAICSQINLAQADIPECAKKIDSEIFWERLAREKWSELDLSHHGFSWKRLFLERYLSELMEKYYPGPDDGNWQLLLETVLAVRPHVHSLQVREMLCHYDLAQICGHLSNLCVLDVTYGNRSMGIDFVSDKVGISEDDATVLGRIIANSKILSRLSVQQSGITDEMLSIFMPSFDRNKTLTYLDLSHNRINDFGAKQLSHWISHTPILTHLFLKHNFIGEEGAAEIVKALAKNTSLLRIDFSLNRFGDQQGAQILKAIQNHETIEELSMSSNNLGPLSALALVDLIKENSTIQKIDLSCNNLHFKVSNSKVKDPSPSLGRALKNALAANGSLCHVDLRQTGFTDDALQKFDKLVAPTRMKLDGHRRKMLNARGWEKVRFEI